jgi:hypothetical protein
LIIARCFRKSVSANAPAIPEAGSVNQELQVGQVGDASLHPFEVAGVSEVSGQNLGSNVALLLHLSGEGG